MGTEGRLHRVGYRRYSTEGKYRGIGTEGRVHRVGYRRYSTEDRLQRVNVQE